MQKQCEISAADGRVIQVYGVLPLESVQRVMVLSHGMAEHLLRYRWFAEQLAAAGVAVYAAHHRGHGEDSELLGHYADQGGWHKVVDDLHQVVEYAKQQHAAPLILLGHSMGSFVARQYAIKYGQLLDGLILSGSNHQPALLFKAGLLAAKIERRRLGARSPSKLLDFLSFGSFNQRFKPVRTEYDWLSRDSAEVDRYIDDPLCGFSCTTQFWCDFMQGLADISRSSAFQQIAWTLPVLVFSGAQDPVGQMGKGVQALARALQEDSGCQVRCILYPEGRHEMLNELNREQVVADIQDWLAAIPQAK